MQWQLYLIALVSPAFPVAHKVLSASTKTKSTNHPPSGTPGARVTAPPVQDEGPTALGGGFARVTQI